MKRRDFLKLVGLAVAAPSLPVGNEDWLVRLEELRRANFQKIVDICKEREQALWNAAGARISGEKSDGAVRGRRADKIFFQGIEIVYEPTLDCRPDNGLFLRNSILD